MNNRFKFRVWDKLAKRMIYPHNDNQQHFIIDLNGRFHNLQNGSGGDDYVIQQYTGLTDSNDNPIYEDDIVKYNLDKPNIERIGIIEFSYYYKGWAIKDSHCYPLSDFGVYSLASPFLSFNWTEIVGNIFEHENLLK